LQTIALVCHIKETFEKTGPSLIIAPLSVLYSWCDEIQKWAPSVRFLRYHSSNPESMETPDFVKYDMVITTYEMAKAPHLKNTVWSRQQFVLAVLDEGHRIKSADTLISQAVRRIHCEQRIILTGTPLANNLEELWSLLNFLVPDVFTTSAPFAEAFDLTNNVVDKVKLEQANRVLKLFMIRRLKSEVEKLMPRKIETRITCPLSKTQIWWYKAILLKDINVLARSDDGEDTKVKAKVLNNLIMQLRKCCNHPYLFPDAEDVNSTTLEDLVGASGKLAVLDQLLCSLYKQGERVVVFSQFTSTLDILEDYCSMREWKHCRFDGSTARAKRNYLVKAFNAPDSNKFVFLMSTRSGGMGLNLQAGSSTVILFDSDWNPQPDLQAMARCVQVDSVEQSLTLVTIPVSNTSFLVLVSALVYIVLDRRKQSTYTGFSRRRRSSNAFTNEARKNCSSTKW
jgi:SWI/SNF-related matrix-associated actin-dependent regulator of chromatin subfamily A member 5